MASIEPLKSVTITVAQESIQIRTDLPDAELAEIVEKYVHKGDKLYIEGRIRYTTYDDKQGQRRYVTEIWADNMEMLTPKTAEPVPTE